MTLARRRGGYVGGVFELRQRILGADRTGRAIRVVGEADVRCGEEQQVIVDLCAPVGQRVFRFGTEVQHRALIIDAAF